MTVDKKVVEEKITAGKELSAEETTAVLQEESAPAGYKEPIVISEETTVGTEDAPEESAEDKAKAATAAADKKKKDDDAAAAKALAEDPMRVYMTKLETELAKPEGTENLEGWSAMEKAYFHQMKRDRKAKQQAETDRDTARFNETKLKKQLEDAKPAALAPAAKKAPKDIIKDKDPSDFLTVAEVREILAAYEPDPNAPAAKAPASESKEPDPVFTRYLHLSDAEARAAHPEDYDAVMELSKEIIDVNSEYLNQVADAVKKAENPAEKMYALIKADPAFEKLFPVAKVKADAKKKAAQPARPAASVVPEKPAKTAEEIAKENKALQEQKKLEQSTAKTKTTADVETSSDTPVDDMTLEQYLAMSDREFQKLPKKKRESLLQKFG